MLSVTDQIGNVVTLKNTPQRIVSVVPSQTELLYHLGLANGIAGITRFCIHPANQVKYMQKVGGTKQLDIDLIKTLNPDLIIANKEENERKQVEELMALYPTYISNPITLPGALDMIGNIGELVGAGKAAHRLSVNIRREFDRLAYVKPLGLKAAYLIWRKPYMIAGTDTFINDMLQRSGFKNAFNQDRYPEVTMEQLIAVRPDVVLLSSEPYPFKQKHADEFQQALPGAIIKLVDGEMFSWYGSRLLYAPEYFIGLTDSIAAC
jgi:ABC-type Fe3+-hydroxamate transport system substrate-binding protein